MQLNCEAKRGRGRRSPAARATEAVETWVLPARAPSTSAAVPPVKPAAVASSRSAAQTEMRSPGHCSSGAPWAPALRCACCRRDGGGPHTQHQSHSGASSGGSLWTCRRYLLRTGSADHPSCCPLNSDPRRPPAPERPLRSDSEQMMGRKTEQSMTGCFSVEGRVKKRTHWEKGRVPVQVRAVFQPIRVTLAVQFTCEVKAVALKSDLSRTWVQCCCSTTQTVLGVEGVRSLGQGTATRGTAETLPVEVEALCTEPFHHVHSLLTWVAPVARGGESPPYRGDLKQHRQGDDSFE